MKRVLITGICAVLVLFAKAQFSRSEAGIMGGVSYYIGDLNPSKHFLLSQPAGGLVYRYNLSPRFAFKVSALYGSLWGSDAVSKANTKRNLSFKSNIFDFSAQMELNFLQYVTGHDKHFISPYIFGGLSVFNFNPRAEYEGKWYSLQPLGTEGQGTTIEDAKKPYSLTSVGIPFGLGLKVSLFKFMCVGAEYGIRKTFTDYIDDVSTRYADPVVLGAENSPIAALLADRTLLEPGESVNNAGLQRGNSNTKDWYAFACLSVTFQIKNRKQSCPAYKQGPKYKIRYNN